MPERIANPLVVALDVSSREVALDVCHSLDGMVDIFKVGLRLFVAEGSQIVQDIADLGHRVFLDLKLCDIPFQVSCAAEQMVKMRIKMFTVHTMGGLEMMKGVVEATEVVSCRLGIERPLVLGVTVLTSWNQKQMQELGINREVQDQVTHLAQLAQAAGLDGVVASAQEVNLVRQVVGKGFVVVTPGIRPSWAARDDQKRVVTPKDAIEAGADYIVMGRTILSSENLREAASKVLDEIAGIA